MLWRYTRLRPGRPSTNSRTQGEALKRRGDAEGALAFYQRAAAQAPTSAEIQDELGFLLAVLKRPGEAKPHFRRAIEIERNFAPAYYHLGFLLWVEEDPSAAIALLETAVKLAPKSFEYRYQLGISLHAVDHPAEAVRELRFATQLQPGSSKAWLSLGIWLEKTGAAATRERRTRKPWK